ncbi:YeeE/YedE family protein [Psychrobacter ciconiae]|uniref:YeeE/YedE family protein n=1 Tax=Psychrobacter ciconiae TaxID=1553449 RepID=UPI001D11CA4A|nr:YeeE/YedE thiosulfate transporter family protein [Psychrobacter ciconiae]
MDWQAFTPISFLGGLIIGVAASLLLLGIGRIAGVSGITASVIRVKSVAPWQVLFLIGLIISPLIYQIIVPLPTIEVTSSVLLLIIAGLLVGFGTQLGSGCTSGHGICGLARFSKRSLVAVITFMATGIITVTLLR